MSGTLYVVGTPIGNLEDMTHRAVRILREVETIAAEDTRHTRRLLAHYGIETSLTSYHEHNERTRTEGLVRRLAAGEDIALVADAGTPTISDPGYLLVRAALEREIPVVPIPGPTACIAALSVSGLPTQPFLFAGFLSPKPGRRRRRLEALKTVPATLVFYESPHRLVRFLEDAEATLGDRPAVVARELTKVHEEVRRGPLSELRTHFAATRLRGEFTIVIAGHSEEATSDDES